MAPTTPEGRPWELLSCRPPAPSPPSSSSPSAAPGEGLSLVPLLLILVFCARETSSSWQARGHDVHCFCSALRGALLPATGGHKAATETGRKPRLSLFPAPPSPPWHQVGRQPAHTAPSHPQPRRQRGPGPQGPTLPSPSRADPFGTHPAAMVAARQGGLRPSQTPAPQLPPAPRKADSRL